jgi:hypothetical protein
MNPILPSHKIVRLKLDDVPKELEKSPSPRELDIYIEPIAGLGKFPHALSLDPGKFPNSNSSFFSSREKFKSGPILGEEELLFPVATVPRAFMTTE